MTYRVVLPTSFCAMSRVTEPSLAPTRPFRTIQTGATISHSTSTSMVILVVLSAPVIRPVGQQQGFQAPFQDQGQLHRSPQYSSTMKQVLHPGPRGPLYGQA